MSIKTVDYYLMNAEKVMFICPEDNNGVPAVFVIFKDFNIGISLYSEVDRVNKTNPQYLGFKKSHSSIILSFLLESTNLAHAKMLLDYNEKEFNDFISKVNPSDSYIILFGNIEDGYKKTSTVGESPITFRKYLLE